MKPTELTLPEFAFIDGSEHEENILKGRTVFIHIRTSTMLELFDKDDAFILNDTVHQYEFEHINIYGDVERLVIAAHFTFADDLHEVFEKAAEWYRDYCNWEDRNINNE